MANEVQRSDPRPPIHMTQRGPIIRSIDELARVAAGMVAGGIAPKGMTKEAALGVMMFGMELGLSPIQSLKDICFYNGKPAAYGDAVTGLINRSGLLAAAPEVTYSQDKSSCRVVLRRRGLAGEFVGEYSFAMAKRANLLGKDNWKNYPERMLFFRAYTYAARDGFSDVLKGLTSREEMEDMGIPTTPEVIPTRRVEQIEDIREVPPSQGIDLAPDPEPPAEPPAPAAPAKDQASLFAEWQRVAKVIKEAEIAEIRGMLGVSTINPKLPAETLEKAISLARDLVRE